MTAMLKLLQGEHLFGNYLTFLVKWPSSTCTDILILKKMLKPYTQTFGNLIKIENLMGRFTELEVT